MSRSTPEAPEPTLSDAQREELAMAIHEARRCNCDSGDSDRMIADELAPLISKWIHTDPGKIGSVDAALAYRRDLHDLERRHATMLAKIVDVPRWLQMNGMDPMVVDFVRTALEAATTTPPES